MVAAGVTLFLGMWRATQQASAAGPSNTSGGSNNGSFGRHHDDNTGSSQNDNGPSGVNTQPGNIIPSTGSGVS